MDWKNSKVTVSENSFNGYRTAVNATKANVVVAGNRVKKFQGAAIIVKDSQTPAHIYGNTATSTDAKAKVVEVQGTSGIVEGNTLKKE